MWGVLLQHLVMQSNNGFMSWNFLNWDVRNIYSKIDLIFIILESPDRTEYLLWENRTSLSGTQQLLNSSLYEFTTPTKAAELLNKSSRTQMQCPFTKIFHWPSQEKLSWLQQSEVFLRRKIKSCFIPNSGPISSAQSVLCFNQQLEPNTIISAMNIFRYLRLKTHTSVLCDSVYFLLLIPAGRPVCPQAVEVSYALWSDRLVLSHYQPKAL